MTTSKTYQRPVLVVVGVGGMGVAVARRLGPGHSLLVADQAREALRAVEVDLTREGHHVTATPLDVRDRDAVRALAEQAAELGPVRALVNTAGVSPVGSEIPAILDVNLLGTAHVLEAFADVMDDGASAVTIASLAGHQASLSAEQEDVLGALTAEQLPASEFMDPDRYEAPNAAYAVSKRGNQLQSAVTAQRWLARGVRLNSISPGMIATEMAASATAAMRSGPPSGDRPVPPMGTPDDIAAAVEFLLGPRASFITGTDLLVDGGALGAGSIPVRG